MQLFRKLAGNIFFKIILAFVALSFVLFGISGFILGNPNSWVIKIGDTSVSYNTFVKAMQSDRELVLASSKSEEAMKYLDSEQFKSDVLGRLVNRAMVEKLHNEFGTSASKKLILGALVSDPSFKNKEGKFDKEVFEKFLAKNGMNEEKYVSEIANNITATMIIQTLSMAAPLNYSMVLEAENFKQEKRLADVVTISTKNVSEVTKISDDEIAKFFEANKQQYVLPEMRKVSYLHFSKKDFAKDFQISDAEILAEYEKNKEQFTKAESRNFYHVLFDNEVTANDFLEKLKTAQKADKSKVRPEFVKIAKELQKKDLIAITLSDITKRDLIPEVIEPIFKLEIDQHTDVIKSPLGFHIFLLTSIKKPQPIPFAEVKNSLKERMVVGREEKILQAKISEIDDALLTSNSLTETAKKFNLKMGNTSVMINQSGQDENGKEVAEIKDFGDFSQNAFTLKKDQTSKIFYNKNSSGFYALKIEDITPAHERDLAKIKPQIVADLTKSKKHEALQKLAEKIAAELKAHPAQATQIAAKYHAKFEKNREFPRIYYINFQGRQVPYQNKFLDELFGLRIGQATEAIPGGADEFVVGILREIKKSNASGAQFEEAKKQAAEAFKTETLQEYNAFLLKEHPVKINEKILGKK